jgi:hypothetical protein
MFFKKKVSVEDYCTWNLTPLFSKERETTWETLRQASNDSQLMAVQAQLYYDHLRAVFIQLMLIAVAKSCSMHTSMDVHFFVMTYLKRHKHSEIDEISKGYNQAFGSSGLAPNRDGVAEMVAHFASVLTSDRLQQATLERLYVEFQAILKIFINDLGSIKLVPSSGKNSGDDKGFLSLLIKSVRFNLIWYLPLCLGILFYFIIPNVKSGYDNITLVFQRFRLAIFFSPSLYLFFSAIVGSVLLPLKLLLLIPIFFDQNISTYKRRYLLSFGVVVGIAISCVLLQVIIWGSFPLIVDKNGYIHIRFIPFLPWPETPLLE